MAEQNRTPRASSARKQEWRPPETLPEPNKLPGYAYRWIRTSMMGTADPRNVHSKTREGWEPVSVKEQPHMQMFVDTHAGRDKDAIEIGGLILCKMPEEFVEQRRRYYNTQAARQMDTVDNNFMRENDARMPLFRERKSEVSFGNGAN